MKSTYIEEIESIANEIQPLVNGFTFRGKQYHITAKAGTDYDTALYNRLIEVLYSEWYAKKKCYQNGQPHSSAPRTDISKQAFHAGLSASNQSVAVSDPGWVVNKILDGGFLQIEKYGCTRTMIADDAKPGIGAGYSSLLNQPVNYIGRKENSVQQQGFYYVYSNALFEYEPSIIRFYWNMQCEGAAPLISEITTRLNYYQLPFMFKCLNDPDYYVRRDCSVLYMKYSYFRQAFSLLQEINKNVSSYLSEDAPLFTYQPSAGFGIAESPVSGSSFGMSRVGIVAGGLVSAFKAKQTLPGQRVAHILAAFTAAGINPQTCFLESNSKLNFN